MTKIIATLLFGYLLVALEAIVPGGVLGLLGFICLLASSYFAHLEYGGWVIPLIVFLLGGLGGVMLVFLQFKWLAKSKWGKNMFVHATSGKSKNKNDLLELVGKQAVAHTDHHPEGLVKVKGETYDSFCTTGYIPKGTGVEITKVDSFRLIIKPL
jgi:membrane-bound serine protease (ClpP class)